MKQHLIKFPSPPSHRPWKTSEVPVGQIVRNHGDKGSKDEGRYLIIGADERGVALYCEQVAFKDMLEWYTMDDGQPCGTKL